MHRSIVASLFTLLTSPLGASPVVISGTVQTASGVPLPEAKVSMVSLISTFEWSRWMLVEGRDAPLSEVSTLTEDTGRFRLESPEVLLGRVLIEAEGFVPMQYFPVASVNATELPPVALHRDVGVRVETQDEAGRPLAEVVVVAVASDTAFWSERAVNGWRVGNRSGRSNRDGEIYLPRAEGERLDISALLPGTAVSHQSRQVERRASATLSKHAVVRHRIRCQEQDGRPIAGLLVTVGSNRIPIGITAEDGTMNWLSKARHLVRLHLLASDGRYLKEALGSLEAGEAPLASFTFPALVHLQGRVVDAGRRPISGALVWPSNDPGRFVRTDSEGRYEIAASSRDRFWLQAEAAGYLPRRQRIDGEAQRRKSVPALALTSATSVRGQLVDSAGASIANVRIEAHAESPTPALEVLRFDEVAGRSWSKGDGRFTLYGLHPNGIYRLTAAREGFVTAELSVSHPDPAVELYLRLRKARSAFGHVVDTAGDPVPDVEVEATAASDSRKAGLLRALTDEAGRFELPRVPASRIDLEVRKEGYSALTVSGVELPPGERPLDVGTLTLEAGAVIRGIVTDVDDAPLAGVEVDVAASHARPQPDRDRREEPEATTDGDGRFSIPDLRRGARFDLSFESEGYLPSSVPGVEAGDPEPLNIVLEAASWVSGRVIDEGRSPVESAQVNLRSSWAPGSVTPHRLPLYAETTLADRQGHFKFDGAGAGSYEIDVLARGFVPAAALRIEVPAAGAVEDLLIVLERGAVVEGVVSNSAGTPVAGTRVRVDQATATSDIDGFYRLEGVPTGRQRLEARHRDYRWRSEELDVVTGTQRADLVLIGGFRVNGWVLNEQSLPVSGARVFLRLRAHNEYREYEAVSGEDGGFQFSSIVDGHYDLRAVRSGYAPSESEEAIEVAGGPVEDLEIVLTEGASISGRILGLELRDLALIQVQAHSAKPGHRPAKVTHEGRYQIFDLEPGDWRVEARTADGSRQAEIRIQIVPGERSVERDLEFGRGLTLDGHVTFGGEPLGQAMVTVTGHDVAARRSVSTDSQGVFRIADLPPANYRLSLSQRREALIYNQDFVLSRDRKLEIEIATARLSGVVISATDASPLADVAVSVLRLMGPDGSAPGSRITVTTGPTGWFHVTRLARGRYHMTAHRDGYSPLERILEIEPGEDLDLELELAAAQGLDLMVRLADGRAPVFATVSVIDAAGRLMRSEGHALAEDGSAHFSTLPPGSWDLLVTAEGGAAARVSATVPGPALDVVLAPASRLEVRVPSLAESEALASVTLTGADGKPFQVVESSGALRRSWDIVAGSGEVPDVPIGAWRVAVTSPDGRAWHTTVITSGEPELQAILE